MGKIEDLTGKKFHHLTVIGIDERKTKEKGSVYWEVECDCSSHTRFSVLAYNLKSGNTKKCKYCRAKNIIGKRFNRLIVLERVIDKDGCVMWKCKCDCGNIIITRGSSLRSGHTKSCGCLQRDFVKKLNSVDMIGKKFGKLTVVRESEKRDSNGNKYWFCDCDCGTKNHEVSGRNLRLGRVLSCGCFRSRGEEKISNILSENNIKFKREYIVKDFKLSTGGHPKFDFAILDDSENVKYFIEYNGEQHYFSRGSIFTKESVEKIKKRDIEKINYCEENKIPLLVIPYTKYENLELNDLILPCDFCWPATEGN